MSGNQQFILGLILIIGTIGCVMAYIERNKKQ